MKRTKTMELTGVIVEGESKLIIENDLRNIGWKVESFKIICNDLSEAPSNTWVARLDTTAGIIADFAVFNRNDVLGIATYGSGGTFSMIDETQLIVDELYITNSTIPSATVTNPALSYQIILGQYDISDYEQIVSQVKRSQG